MKNNIKILCMIMASIIFLPIGSWLNNQTIANPYAMPPFALVNLICLVMWINFSFLMKNTSIDTKVVMLCIHIIPAIVLLLIAYQEFVLKSFRVQPLGQITQLYYMPLIWITLPRFGPSMFFNYLSALLTLMLCCFIGCKAKEALLKLKGDY